MLGAWHKLCLRSDYRCWIGKKVNTWRWGSGGVVDSCLSPEPAARTLTNLRCGERPACVRRWDGPPVLSTLTAGWEDYRTKEVAADCMTVDSGSRVRVYVHLLCLSLRDFPTIPHCTLECKRILAKEGFLVSQG